LKGCGEIRAEKRERVFALAGACGFRFENYWRCEDDDVVTDWFAWAIVAERAAKNEHKQRGQNY
jgi:hypothetical protein